MAGPFQFLNLHGWYLSSEYIFVFHEILPWEIPQLLNFVMASATIAKLQYCYKANLIKRIYSLRTDRAESGMLLSRPVFGSSFVLVHKYIAFYLKVDSDLLASIWKRTSLSVYLSIKRSTISPYIWKSSSRRDCQTRKQMELCCWINTRLSTVEWAMIECVTGHGKEGSSRYSVEEIDSGEPRTYPT
jgi:hypothetical protein